MAKSESSSRIVTSVVAVISAAALAVSLIMAGFCGVCCARCFHQGARERLFDRRRPRRSRKTNSSRPRCQTKRYTIDDNDKAAVYATIAAINAQEALAGTAGKGAPKIDATANYVAGELSGEQVAALEAAFDAASERYVLTPDAVSHLDDVFGVVQARNGGFLPPW